jgi:hypothetical protein
MIALPPVTTQYTRKISFSERLSIAADRILPPFTNNMILEGCGAIDFNRLKSAVEAASEANPGSRLVLRGALNKARWVDSGKCPRVREADGSGWSGLSSEGAPYLQEPHSLITEGPLCDVILIHGNPLRLSFRTHHGIMDARGTMLWVEDIFRVLRNEPLMGSHSILTDMDIPMPVRKEKGKSNARACIALTGVATGKEHGMIWIRRQIAGRFRNLLAQVAVLTAAAARTHSNGKVIFNVPVDRRTVEAPLSTANLTVSVNIEVPPGASPEALTEEIKTLVRDQGRYMGFFLRKIYPFIPTGVIVRVMEAAGGRMRSSGRYPISGIISNVGKIPLEKYTGGGFHADTSFFIPPNLDIIPAFIGLFGTGDSIGIIINMPKVLADSGRIEALMEHVVSGLVR